MQFKTLTQSALAAALAVASGVAFAQSVNLTASASGTSLPDGQPVPMWGYSCGAVTDGVTCTRLKAGGDWSPVLITASPGSLTIRLTNSLPTPPGADTGIQTSLVIVGQLGGGLGNAPVRTQSPVHQPQGTTWPAKGDADPSACLPGGDPAAAATFCPPAQRDRVRSFASEVATGATASLTWNNLKPGTYLIHSGTHPSIQSPMGLYAMLVVRTPADAALSTKAQAYPGVTYDADVPLLLSEIDPAQNAAVAAAVATAGFDATKVWSGQLGECGDPASPSYQTCYPPTVNYDPRYYLINGGAFNRASPSGSLFAAGAAPVSSGKVLLRFVNAGSRMHVPSVVGAQTGSPAAAGIALIAEDGNVLPGVPKVQSQVFLPAGKTYDVMINAPAAGAPALPLFDRALSLSTSNQRDGGMQGYIGVNGAGVSLAAATVSANGETYNCVAGTALQVLEPSRGVLANDRGANGATLDVVNLVGGPDSLSFQPNGTFTYAPPADSTTCGGSFSYLVNGTTTATATIQQCDANVHAAGCPLASAPTANPDSYTAVVTSRLQVSPPGVLANDDAGTSGLALSAAIDTCTPAAGYTCLTASQVTLNRDGSFVATPPTAGVNYMFQYHAVNTQKTPSAPTTVTITVPNPTGLTVNIKDAKNGIAINDYRWIVEEDRTFFVDPKCQVNTGSGPRPLDSRGQPCPPLPVPSLGTNFHTSQMPVVAQGCVGGVSCESGQTVFDPMTATHVPTVCDVGNGACRTDAAQKTEVRASALALDPSKRYYISILPGDGVNPVIGGAGGAMQVNPACDPSTTACAMRQFDIAKDCGAYNPSDPRWTPGDPGGLCGHAMGGAQIVAGQSVVNISLQQAPLPTAKISVFVFQDDYPLNGEIDAGGGTDMLAPNEPGLGGFELKLLDQAGNFGDSTGQITYDMFNMPVSNALAGTIDPVTGLDACPITKRTDGIVGMIPTCPRYEADGVTLSPLAGHAVIANLYPGLYEVVATPAADRIARGEEWLQTNTLDGTKAIEAFIRPGEPSYFQEFGPGGYHVAVGFANPKIINNRKNNAGGTGMCDPQNIDPTTGGNTGGGGMSCPVTVTGLVTNTRMSRTPDQRVYSSGSYDSYSFTQCYASLGMPDGADFAFAKCDDQGRFRLEGIPVGNYRITIFDQWNDLLVDGLSTPIVIGADANNLSNTTNTQCSLTSDATTHEVTGGTCNYEIPVTQWRTNLYTRAFVDLNGDGVSQPEEPGLSLVATNIRFRDGSFGFFNNTDLDGYAGFNEVFPFLNWLVVESDTTRYKTTGVHVVYDAGGPVDGTTGGGNSSIGVGLANTIESPTAHLPLSLRIPGSRYCATADCPAGDAGFNPASGNPGSTGRVDPGWANTQAWAGLLGQNSFLEFAMKPFIGGENGGIKGHVIYASTRPFDDPSLLLQLSWEPGVPNVRINLYQVGTAPDGSRSLKLVDWTMTTSFDAWAQGFRRDTNGNVLTDASGNAVANMNCPGQETTSPFYFTLQDSRAWLNPNTAMAERARFKCYDGWSMLNQVQPAPYDGMYKFPSVRTVDPSGEQIVQLDAKTHGTNCSICTRNPDDGTPMLPPGKYVVEVIVPRGYELVKEEDKNILIGDNYVAPVTQQFAGLGNIFILPDQAAMNAYYNRTSRQNSTTNLGARPRHEGDTGMIEVFWPCVGATRIVPDFNSLFPGAQQSAPFAGASRALCDRKEVVLEDQMSVLAKFYIFSSTHVAGKYTGMVTNDFASEFDPFSPQFGEKFAVPNLPVAFKDFNGNEMSRVYTDQWGAFNGMNYSSWGVNPPNPTGYVPQMMIACMNDPGPIPGPNGTMITDPMYNPAYSNFCYQTPFMPGQTAYMDTPVIPTMAFAAGYNLPDCDYPDATPAIKQVDGDGLGPWVSTAGGTLSSVTITNGGSGYTAAPTLTFGAPGGGETRATGTAVITNGVVTAVNITNRGTGYTAAPTVTFTAAPIGGVTASATASITSGGTLTITALGDKQVLNHAYSGPQAANVPFNQKLITRHYGFGSTAGTVALVGSDGVARPLTNVTWSDTSITGTLPVIQSNVSTCAINQRTSPASVGSSARCAQLVITAANGKQSIDTVTVTIAGKAPTRVTGPNGTDNALQTAIDNAAPGDLILVAPGTYRELLLMWKPVRLQGAGAGSVIIDANAHPAGKLDPWRRQVNCLFGLALNGQPISAGNEYDPSGTYSCPTRMQQRVDRIPFEIILGWDVTANGNLAQMLQEPTLMGAYEGAGITVLGRGFRIPGTSTDFFGRDVEGGLPVGSAYLTNGTADCTIPTNTATPRDYGTSNFLCNPSRIDGITVTNSSQGGGAIFLHGWNHSMQIANTRLYANHGTLTGGITVGYPEFPIAYIVGGVDPIPFPTGNLVTGQQAGYGFNKNVNVHHNAVTSNASMGDSLFSGTPSAAGGVTFCTGADNYKFRYNWVCGNLSTGDGGGVVHQGFSNDAEISRNWILFNQSTNPTLPTNGGGLAVLGASPDRTLPNGQECGTTTDVDCPPGLSEGTGRNLLIDANLIIGNSAESGSGGGLRLQAVNGEEVVAFPTAANTANRWHQVTVTNNIIANNVAGWDGGGVSMQDALKVKFFNNTVIANDTTASAGVLFNTLGAPMAAMPPPGCTPQPDPTLPQSPSCINPVPTSTPQAAGLVTMQNSPNLVAALPTNTTCPTGNTSGTTGTAARNCTRISYPEMRNNLFWQNRAFKIVVDGLGTGQQDQQHLVTLSPALNQPQTPATSNGVVTGGTGACVNGASYWDIGIRGDTGPTNHNSGFTLRPLNSMLTSLSGGYNFTGSGNIAPSASGVVQQYCNGSRLPPENGGKGYNAPPGHSETTGLYPVFQLVGMTPAATVDEGNNWINLDYGPLSLSNPSSYTAKGTLLPPLGDYSLRSTSAAINSAASVSTTTYPSAARDFFGTTRPQGSGWDIGAVEFVAAAASPNSNVGPTSLAFGNVVVNTSTTLPLTLSNTGNAALNSINVAATGTGYSQTNTCGTSLAAGSSCTITVRFQPTATGGPVNGQVTVTASNDTVTGSPVQLSGTGVAATYTASVSPSSLNFGGVVMGTTSSAIAVTVTNTGNSALASLLYNISPSQFSRAPGAAAGDCGATLAVGASCTYNVVFQPTAGTSYNGTLTISQSGATVTPASIALSGNGTGATYTASVSPSTGAFGNVLAGQTSTTTLTVTNTGNSKLTGLSYAVPAGAFSRPSAPNGGTCIDTLDVGASCTVNILFAPTAVQGYSGTLTVAGTGATVTPSTVQLSGNGTATYTGSVSPSSLSFGNVFTGTTSSAQTVTVTNTGSGTLTGLAYTPTAPFSRAGGTCVDTLAAGASCTVNVVFAPTSAGASSGTLTIGGTGATITPASVSLLGTGVTPTYTASVSPSPLAFGSVTTGSNSTANVTVSNTGNQPLSLTYGSPTAPFSRSAGSPGTCGSSLAVGASCTYGVQFTPTTNGPASGTLTVSGSGVTVTGSPVNISGTGATPASAVSITPNPLTITVPTSGTSATGIVTFRNTNAAGGASVSVSSVAVSGGSPITYTFSKVSDSCTGAALAPGVSCNVTVSFMNTPMNPKGVNRNGTITFTDTASGSPHTGPLIGYATP